MALPGASRWATKPSRIRERSMARSWGGVRGVWGGGEEGAAYEGSEEHHEGRSDEETLIHTLAFAVVEQDPDGDYEEERGETCGISKVRGGGRREQGYGRHTVEETF
jgi:hypothetical protein